MFPNSLHFVFLITLFPFLSSFLIWAVLVPLLFLCLCTFCLSSNFFPPCLEVEPQLLPASENLLNFLHMQNQLRLSGALSPICAIHRGPKRSSFNCSRLTPSTKKTKQINKQKTKNAVPKGRLPSWCSGCVWVWASLRLWTWRRIWDMREQKMAELACSTDGAILGASPTLHPTQWTLQPLLKKNANQALLTYYSAKKNPKTIIWKWS